MTPSASDTAVQRVGLAAQPYESRWTLSRLKEIDPELHALFAEQQSLYHEALVTRPGDLEVQSAAMCRAWVAITRRMEAAGVEDDAYVIGRYRSTVVAVGAQKAAIARVREVHGERVVWLTPDEVAAMIHGAEALMEVKALWPDAEIVNVFDRYPDEPAKEDAP